MFPLRDENPSHRFPLVTVAIIVVNCLAFIWEFSGGPAAEQLIYQYAMLPIEVSTGQNLADSTAIAPYVSIFTSMFLHGGIGHLLGNMWFLWIFGDNLEDHLGHLRYFVFYLVTGVAAALTHVAFNAQSDIPTLGASGAISGVLGGYLVLFPKIRVRTLITLGFYFNIVYVPAIAFLGLWFVMQLLGGFGGQGGIAFGAHIGGFVAGVLWMLVFSRPAPETAIHRYDARRIPRW